MSTYETFEIDNTTKTEPHKFILSFTVHIGLQEDNDWLGFNNLDEAHVKRKELDSGENVSNINLSTVIGKING